MCQNQLYWLHVCLSETYQDWFFLPSFARKKTFYFYTALLPVVKIFSIIPLFKWNVYWWRLLSLWNLYWTTPNLVIVSHAIMGGNTAIFSNKPWSSSVKSTLTTLLWILLVCSGKGDKVLGFERSLTRQRMPKLPILIHPGELNNFHRNCVYQTWNRDRNGILRIYTPVKKHILNISFSHKRY